MIRMNKNKTNPKFDPVWLDAQYNNRALVPDHATYFARWKSTSIKARQEHVCRLDIPYGAHQDDGMNETLDIFPATSSHAPVLSVERSSTSTYWSLSAG